MPTLWEGEGGLGACHVDVPRIGEPEEKELCAGPPLLLVMTTYQADAAWFSGSL
jgi:hypothetical protein